MIVVFQLKLNFISERFAVKMSDVKCVGRTDENWNGFTETKKGATNPVQYVSRETLLSND